MSKYLYQFSELSESAKENVLEGLSLNEVSEYQAKALSKPAFEMMLSLEEDGYLLESFEISGYDEDHGLEYEGKTAPVFGVQAADILDGLGVDEEILDQVRDEDIGFQVSFSGGQYGPEVEVEFNVRVDYELEEAVQDAFEYDFTTVIDSEVHSLTNEKGVEYVDGSLYHEYAYEDLMASDLKKYARDGSTPELHIPFEFIHSDRKVVDIIKDDDLYKFDIYCLTDSNELGEPKTIEGLELEEITEDTVLGVSMDYGLVNEGDSVVIVSSEKELDLDLELEDVVVREQLEKEKSRDEIEL